MHGAQLWVSGKAKGLREGDEGPAQGQWGGSPQDLGEEAEGACCLFLAGSGLGGQREGFPLETEANLPLARLGPAP